MVTAITIVSMLVICVTTWFLGLWNNVLTFVNVLLAALIASSWFEPLADRLDGDASSYTYLLDFICLWVLFFISLTFLRGLTDLLSRTRLDFDLWLDRGLRTVFSLATAWVFACFLQFSMHMAPLPTTAFQATPATVNFPGSPDRLWLGFLQSRSRGALSASLNEPLAADYDLKNLHPDDQTLQCRVFDSRADLIYKYHDRRTQLEGQTTLRVRR